MDLFKDWKDRRSDTAKSRRLESKTRTLVNVGGVGLLPGLSPLLLGLTIARGRGLSRLLCLGLRGSFSRSLGGGGGRGLSGSRSWLGWHVWLKAESLGWGEGC